MCGLCVELVAVENDLLEACMLSSLSLNTRCTTADCPRSFGCKGPSHLPAIRPQSQRNHIRVRVSEVRSLLILQCIGRRKGLIYIAFIAYFVLNLIDKTQSLDSVVSTKNNHAFLALFIYFI